MLKLGSKIFDFIFSEENRKKIEGFTIWTATIGFIFHLSLVLLNNNSIINIIELKNKELLFVSKDGISVFNRELFDFKRVRIPIPISVLDDNNNKRIFVTTSFDGVYILDYDFNILKNFKRTVKGL